MAVKPGYKETDVGIIPAQWDCIPIANAARLESGHTPSRREPSYWGGNFHWVSLHDTDALDGAEIYNTAKTITQEGLNHSSARLLPKGTVVFSRTATVGKACVLGREMATSQDFANYVCGPQLHNHFLVYLFRSMGRVWQSFMAGSIHNTIYMPVFKALKIACPPLHEQRAIASALSDVDALLGSLDRLIAKKRDLKHAAMQQLLTGRIRLPGFKEKWELKSIAEIATPRNERNIVGDELPVLTCSKHLGFVDSMGFFKNQVFSKNLAAYKVIRRGEIGYPSNHVEEGSIGLQTLYEVALVSPIYVVFKVNESVNSYFLHRLLKLDSYRQKFKTATSASVDRRGSLRWPAFSKITVRLPGIAEQTAISEVLVDMEDEIATLEKRREKTRYIKDAMMQELLTGRIRLVGEEANVLPFPTEPQAASSQSKPHNWQINEAVVIATLVHRFGSEEFPLGRKRYTKLSYLLHRHVERTASGYLKKAAGPYNPATKYKGPEGIAVRNRYVQKHSNGQYEGFVAAEKIADAQAYFQKWYGDEALRWLDQFRYKKNDDLELLATVDMAMEDLRRAGTSPTLDAVKKVIRDHPEWEAKLNRPIFSDTSIATAMEICEASLGGS